uniref:Fe2OG dioxygenase domain-containing protein n=1 Tax=Gossypium raimondii TaxID=29730 RepID=A0A0D2T151_GOSRA|nr:hypothetical protein B456_008G062900 [Gossypium raimondii]
MAPSTLTALAEEKTLQASFVRDEDERPKVAYNQFSNDIPVISLAGIDDVDGKRGEICKKIVEACEDWGVFQVVDHGVDTKLVSEMTPCKLLEVLSEAMGLEKEALTKACVDMDQKVVVNFYPKCPQPDLTLGLKRHTDPGTITLLLQDQVGGLQATRDNGKTWITVQPVEGAFVVNLGDHGHYLSNGRFKNADHQAVVNSNCSRLSIATFQNPAPDATVYPLKIREGEKPILEEPITFAEMYRRKMSKDLELARLKKLAKEQQQLKEKEAENEKPKLEAKPLEEILA